MYCRSNLSPTLNIDKPDGKNGIVLNVQSFLRNRNKNFNKNTDLYLAGVLAALLKAGTHHVVADVQVDAWRQVVIQIVTQLIAQDRHTHMVDNL